MATGNPDLIRLMRAEIEKRGPQSFAWFMQQALYHIDCGYYSSGRCKIGRAGDYFTSVSVGPLFGQLVAAQFVEMWERLGKPGRRGDIEKFVIVEQGAHDGQFAHDVLHWAQKCAPEFFTAVRYRIVEPFPVLQKRQVRTLRAFHEKVEWRDSLQPFTGVHFSNELLDAMPVRLIANGRERLVGLDGDQLVFVEGEVGDQTFNGAALAWVDELAAKLERGYVIAIDYGRLEDEFQGNVQVRAQHRNLDSPFEEIGHADITMHVDWTSIAARGRENGLYVAGFTDQHHFLMGIISELADDDLGRLFPADSVKAKRELQTLLHPEMLGRACQVLALEKEKAGPGARHLAGFRFAREPRFALKLTELQQ
jgi:SAM-dependent MidA family methyltransferase